MNLMVSLIHYSHTSLSSYLLYYKSTHLKTTVFDSASHFYQCTGVIASRLDRRKADRCQARFDRAAGAIALGLLDQKLKKQLTYAKLQIIKHHKIHRLPHHLLAPAPAAPACLLCCLLLFQSLGSKIFFKKLR